VRAFVVDGKYAIAGRRAEWLGLEAVRAGSVKFDRAPADLLEKSADPKAMARFFARAAVTTAARQVGLARAAYETALGYTQDRKAFGKAVAHFQAISFTLAEMHMDVESARWMVWRAAAELDRGSATAPAAAAEALAHANDAAWRVADRGVQLLGGAGYIQDFPVEKWLRDTKALALVGGCDQAAQLVTAASLVGADLGPGWPIPQLQPVVT
jgi:alkylation response protein AidB-like acyl-CoA dehydrogenase